MKEWETLRNYQHESNRIPPPRPDGRRVVSAPLGLYAASPSRSSPLSRSFGMSSMLDDPSPSVPGCSPSYAPSSRTIPSSHRRRRSSASLHYPPFGSLVGSFENSLLSGRMSAQPSKPLPFLCSIGVLGSKDAPKKLQCPKHLHVEFGAVFYSSKEDRKTSPYVGTIDLEGHYLSLLASATESKKLAKFPGYQVPVRGQLQLVLKNSNQTAFKPFLIPYDLEGLNRYGKGGRTFLRQKSYTVELEGVRESGEGGKLRFAVHLTFCSPPTNTWAKRNGFKEKEPKYYLYQSIRVVFASQALDPTEKVRVVLEGPTELLHGSSKTSSAGVDEEERRRWRESQFGEYRGPSDEWEDQRREIRADLIRREAHVEIEANGVAHERAEEEEDQMATSFTTYSNSDFNTIPANTKLYNPYSDIPSSAALATSSLFAAIPFNHNTVSSSSTTTSRLPPVSHPSHPLSISTTFSSPVSPSFPILHLSPAPLTFDRIPSPISQDLKRLPSNSRDRKQSGVSGLSLSRPNSPALFNVAQGEQGQENGSRKTSSREREMCGR